MCGIAGFCHPKASFLEDKCRYETILQNMTDVLLHRGPDDKDYTLYDRCGLAHTRLAIIDLLGGMQPMSRRLGNHEYTIVYNGELYNAKELKGILTSRGFSFLPPPIPRLFYKVFWQTARTLSGN